MRIHPPRARLRPSGHARRGPLSARAGFQRRWPRSGAVCCPCTRPCSRCRRPIAHVEDDDVAGLLVGSRVRGDQRQLMRGRREFLVRFHCQRGYGPRGRWQAGSFAPVHTGEQSGDPVRHQVVHRRARANRSRIIVAEMSTSGAVRMSTRPGATSAAVAVSTEGSTRPARPPPVGPMTHSAPGRATGQTPPGDRRP